MMKSISAVPDRPRISRRNASIDARLCSMRSATIEGSVSISGGGVADGGPAGAASAAAGSAPSRERTVSSASRISGSPRPKTSRVRARVVGDASRAVTSTNSRPPASCMGMSAVCRQTEMPSGRIASVIICPCPTETYTWYSSSSAAGMGNSVVIGRLCTTWNKPSTRHHSMSCGAPSRASIRRPSSTSCTICSSVSTGWRRRQSGTGTSAVPPSAAARTANGLLPIDVEITVLCRTR